VCVHAHACVCGCVCVCVGGEGVICVHANIHIYKLAMSNSYVHGGGVNLQKGNEEMEDLEAWSSTSHDPFVCFAKYRLFYRALLQKRPMI